MAWRRLADSAANNSCAFFECHDPLPPQRRYSWEDEPEDEYETESHRVDDPLEPPSPIDVEPIWDGPTPPRRGVVLQFPRRPQNDPDDRPPPPTLH
ncbi:MAG: hypothetical protein R3F18_08885 [Lysobacterales bacterium]